MKKIGEYTARGKMYATGGSGPHPVKIPLFDGRFDTGWRVVEFVIGPHDVDNTSNMVYKSKLMTVDTGSALEWNWGDQNELAWAYVSFDANSIHYNNWSHVDPDHLIIEDLYVYLEEDVGNLNGNYFIRLEQYEFSEWKGALGMARDKQSE